MARSEVVDAWFTRYDNPKKDVVLRVREIVLGADARIEECIKWQAPTFTYLGNLASFFPKSKQHASLMFHTGALIPGDHPRLEGGGDTSRVLKLGSVAEANAAKKDLERIVRAWCTYRDAAVSAASTSLADDDGAMAHRIRRLLADHEDVVEKRMFGGLCFMVNGKMCCGLTKTDFMVRVGRDAYDEALAQPHARPMDFTGRPLAGMVYVDAAGTKTNAALARWVRRGLAGVAASTPTRARRPRA